MSNIKYYFKLLIERVLKPFDYSISRRIGDEPIDDINRLMAPYNVQHIIDGGAYRGTYSVDMVKTFSDAAIYAFEPHPDSYSLLLKGVNDYPAVNTYNLALGASTDQLTLFTNSSPLTNSLAKISSDGLKNFNDYVQSTGQIKVNVVDLASFMADEKIPFVDVLKLDLQGYELEAIKGLGQLLYSVKLIFMEIQFIEIYQGTPLFTDVEIFLRKKGFLFYQFYGLVKSPENGRLLYGDAIFLNSEYFSL